MKNIKKRTLVPFYLFSIALLTLGNIQTSYAKKPSCQEKLDSVLNDIKGRGARVSHEVYSNYEYLNSVFGNTKRISSIRIDLGAGEKSMKEESVAVNILVSGVLLKSYANQVFSHCGGTGLISFTRYQTDWTVIFVMRDDGVLGFEECNNSPYDFRQSTTLTQVTGPGLDGYCAYVIPDF